MSETPKRRGCLKWQREIGSISVCQILTCNIRTMVFSDNCYLVTVVNITTSPSQRFGVWNRWISCWLSQASWRPWSSPVVFTLSRISSLLGGLPKNNELGMLAVIRVCAIRIYVNLPYFLRTSFFGLPKANLMVRLLCWLCACVLHVCGGACVFIVQHFAV